MTKEITYPDMSQTIREVLSEHNIDGYAVYKDGHWNVSFDDSKQRFIYELNGGDARFMALFANRYLIAAHKIWTADGTING